MWLSKAVQAFKDYLRTSTGRVALAAGTALVVLAVVTGLLATGGIPGVPDAPLKPVSLYASPQAANSLVTAYLQPPASTLQAGEEGQLLSLQVSNHSENTVALQPTTVEPRNCFELHALDESSGQLAAGQTRVISYRLTAAAGHGGTSAAPRCEGQVAASFRYGFQVLPQGGTGKAASAVEGFISTSPIAITTRRTRHIERFLHIAEALTVPLLAGLAGLWFQQFQMRKDDLQKDQELQLADRQKNQAMKLEVWKMIFPIVNGLNSKHYIQMIRRMDDLRFEMGKFPNLDTPRLVAAMAVLQACYSALYDVVGGFNFRTMPAEDIVGPVSITLYEQLAQLAGSMDRFDEFARAVQRKDKAREAAGKLVAYAANDPATQAAFLQFQKAAGDPDQLQLLDSRLDFLRRILAFENNILWYPEWYGTPPVMNFTDLAQLARRMSLPTQQEQDVLELIEKYRMAVPPECRGTA